MRRLLLGSSLALATLLLSGPFAHALGTAPNDPLWHDQWGPQDAFAKEAWTVSTGKGAVIAVVDTGVDVDHPDLKNKLVLVPGADTADNDNNPDDDSFEAGHGTHVAGIAGAITNNSIGVAGMAPDAKIMPIKVWPTDESGGAGFGLPVVDDAISKGIRLAADQGADVINLSLVARFPSVVTLDVVATGCEYAFQRGSLCIIAAGNSGDQPSGYEYNINAVIVTAHKEGGYHAEFGQDADTKWSLSAPGVDIMSTLPLEKGAYGSLQGTSMAAPHVAGAAGLLAAKGLTNTQIANALTSGADPMVDRRTNGSGRLNAARALGLKVSRPSAPGVTTPTEPGGGSDGGDDGTQGSGSFGPVGGVISSGDGVSSDAATSSLDALGDLSKSPLDDSAFDFGGQQASRVEARNKATDVDGPLVLVVAAILTLGTMAGAVAAIRSRGRDPYSVG